MLRHERRLLVDCLVIGVALTVFVIAADAYGVLHRLEDFLYDLRARTCQVFTPRPTDTLVHLDIDDPALETIGAWPWPRATVAKILDEVRLAGPKAVEMDVLFTEPQGVSYVPVFAHADAPQTQPATIHAAPAAATTTATTTTQATTHATTTHPAATQPIAFTRIDNDGELAEAMRRLGNVIVPATFEPMPTYSPLVAAFVEELGRDLELEPDDAARLLRQRGFKLPDGDGYTEQFLIARREAMDIRLRALDLGADVPFDHVRARLLPRTALEIQTAAVNVLREQWTRYLIAREFRRFAWPRPPGMTAYAPMRVQIAPVRVLAAAADGGAFVDYPKFGSPVIRRLPLLLEMEGRVYPQMGLALACRMLDVDPAAITVDARDAIVIPRPGGSPIRLPTAPPRVSTAGAAYGNLFDIPWFGKSHWETMYDWPAQRVSAAHLPINKVWEAVETRDDIRRNNAAVDEAVRGVYYAFKDRPSIDKYNAALPPPDDAATRQRIASAMLAEFQPLLEPYASMKDEELTHDDRVILASVKALRQSLDETPKLLKELDEHRQSLRKQLNGKAVLMGWTATAAIADFVPTTLHEKCPGVVVHGAVYNGIMTGELWRTAPWWVTALTTFFLGALVSFTTARFQPLTASLIAIAVASLFAVVNGVVLFDKFNVLLGAAAPLVAVGAVWSACTLTRVVIEAAERSRITRRFSNYVDPKIVDYVMENPQVTFDGETREMTVVFTDLAGFTAISERLGEKVVPMLNELFGELVPVIRRHEGTLNKFLGDGIMFFFNAPRSMPSHGAVAVKAVLEMHEKIAEFNQRLRGQGLPELSMRAGVMTAEMIVGDAGGAGAADYTVLGDAVNTGSRLEAANKATGTQTLISARTADMLNGEFLIRPIGKLKVVGKDEAVMVFEPMASSDRATDEQRELARCTAELVESYVRGRFASTLELADALENRFGRSKIVAIYRALATHHLGNPPGEDFDGRIVLTEK